MQRLDLTDKLNYELLLTQPLRDKMSVTAQMRYDAMSKGDTTPNANNSLSRKPSVRTMGKTMRVRGRVEVPKPDLKDAKGQLIVFMLLRIHIFMYYRKIILLFLLGCTRLQASPILGLIISEQIREVEIILTFL